MKKLWYIILSLLLALALFDLTDAYSPLIAVPPTSTREQAKQFLIDRDATQQMIDQVDFIYEYCEEVGIDATIIIGISSLETGYGKSSLFVNKNNPGGMKARRGWLKFNTLEDGYRAMIDKIAVMAGVKESKSFYYNSCKYVIDLGNVYWVENGCDKGYYRNLLKQMNKITSYKIKETKKEVVEDKPTIIEAKPKTSAKDYIMSFRKSKSGKGMSIIQSILERR